MDSAEAIDPETILFWVCVTLALIASLLPGMRPARRRWSARRTQRRNGAIRARWDGPTQPHMLMRPFVVDSDTIHDRSTRLRYRLQNIDAPETGDHASCASERLQGERAKWEAIKLVRAARSVEARPTGKIDQHGRTVAFILVDGRDLGELLIQGGLAHRWRGQRERWCGSDGALLRMARTCGKKWHCGQCRLGHEPAVTTLHPLGDRSIRARHVNRSPDPAPPHRQH